MGSSAIQLLPSRQGYPRKQKELDSLKARLAEKTTERDRVLGLFRRGRIDDATLDQQLDVIDRDFAGLQAEIEIRSRTLSAVDQAAQVQSAEELLKVLHKRLEGPIEPVLKRRIVETLVECIQANTVEKWGVPQSELVITYRFSKPSKPAALVVPRYLRVSARNQPPEELITVGDHLLRRRLVLKLLQRQVRKTERYQIEHRKLGKQPH